MTAPSFALLQRVTGYQQMQHELNTLLQGEWYAHVNQRDYAGKWDVMPLRCAAEYLPQHPVLQSFAIHSGSDWRNLPQLAQSPALAEFINSFPHPLKSVRLMRLHPGAEIKPHRDAGLSLEAGEARLHLCLQTNPGLEFRVNQQLVPMQEGELWYINADQTHSVYNKGSSSRISMVLDCQATTTLKEQLYAACEHI